MPSESPPQERETPLPPAQLRYRVAGTEDPEWFVHSGQMALEDFEAALQANGHSYADFSHVYDFGCGCGRLTFALQARMPTASISGSDIDEEAVSWLATAMPQANIRVNGGLPPLPFGDASFDLIVGWSVFTHLPEDYQHAWLAELARVCKPGAVVLQTIHGDANYQWTVDRITQERLDAGYDASDPVLGDLTAAGAGMRERGFSFWDSDGWSATFPGFYHTAFHQPAYIRAQWSRWFEVLDVRLAAGRPTHDVVVLRRSTSASARDWDTGPDGPPGAMRARDPATEAAPPPAENAHDNQPGEPPAETAHDNQPGELELLRARQAETEAALHAAERARDDVYAQLQSVVTSKSWRLTAPLRDARQRAAARRLGGGSG